MRIAAADQLAADLADLKLAADRAGMSLACLFSSSDEFEADLLRERRAEGAFDHLSRTKPMLRRALALTGLTFTFLML
ncbi:MAG: hypothetical protein IT538_08495 [Variibacter sp.]|nr:hypothetical protein [Variibacter sp.]